MLKNKICLLLMVVIILGGEIAMASEEKLSLSLNIDKNAYKFGDTINFKYELRNNSEDNIRITALGFWSVDKINVFDASGKEMRGIKIAKYSIRMIPKEDDFKTIQPKDSFSVSLRGKIKYGTIDIGTVYKGLYLDFNDSCILLPEGEGVYSLKGVAKSNEVWQQEGEKRYGFKNIWAGNIESNEVKIEIIK